MPFQVAQHSNGKSAPRLSIQWTRGREFQQTVGTTYGSSGGAVRFSPTGQEVSSKNRSQRWFPYSASSTHDIFRRGLLPIQAEKASFADTPSTSKSQHFVWWRQLSMKRP
mmetsp:Transcript_30453/g.86085  ORF Transcript_30453/g.86085 Transcript_30453/m.86085 type:complete len:110 (+) Transcript_30453:64-393(+)